MATNTTNYSFVLPAVNSAVDQDLWGGESNGNFTSLDSLLYTATNWVKRLVATATSVTTADRNKILLCDSSGGAYTVTLPAAATAADGFAVLIKKTDNSTNIVTIDGNASETIDGLTSWGLGYNDSVLLVCDGSNWNIAAKTGFNAISSTLASGSATSLVTNTAKNITSISLPAGRYKISAQIGFITATSTSVTDLRGGINSVSATLPATASISTPTFILPIASATVYGSSTIVQPLSDAIVTITTPSTYYLVARGTFTASTLEAFGFIYATTL